MCVANGRPPPDAAEENDKLSYIKIFLIMIATIFFFEARFDFARWSTFFTAAIVLMLFPNLRDPIISHVAHLWDFVQLQEDLFKSLDVYLLCFIVLFFSNKFLPRFLHGSFYGIVPFIAFHFLSSDDPTGTIIPKFGPLTPQLYVALSVSAAVFIRHVFCDETNPEMFVFSIVTAVPVSALIILAVYKAAQYITAISETTNTMPLLFSFSEFSVHIQICLIVCGLTLAKLVRRPSQPWLFEVVTCSIPITAAVGRVVGHGMPAPTGVLRHVASIWDDLYSGGQTNIAMVAVIVVLSLLLQHMLPQEFVAHYRFQTVDDLEEAIRQYYAIADPRKEAGNIRCKDHNLCRRLAQKGFHHQEQLQVELYHESKRYSQKERDKAENRPGFGLGTIDDRRFAAGTPVGWFSEEEIEEFRHRNA